LVDDFEVRKAQAETFPAGVDAGILGAGQATGFRGGAAGVVGSVADDGTEPVEGIGDDSFGGGVSTVTLAGLHYVILSEKNAARYAGLVNLIQSYLAEDSRCLVKFE
jgi:hypothetical protein